MLKHNFDNDIDAGDFQSDLEAAMAEYSDLYYEDDFYNPHQMANYTYIMDEAYLINLN